MNYNPNLKRFEVFTSYQEYKAGYVQKVKDAGFRFEKTPVSLWYTDDPDKASLLISCANPEVHAMLDDRVKTREKSLSLSRANSADLGSLLDGIGIEPYDFQKAGIAYGLDRDRVLLADEPGLGKTLQALALVHIRRSYPCVAIVPATIKINWFKEAVRCIPELREDGAVRIIKGRAPKDANLLEGKNDPGALLWIINYDILDGWVPALSRLSLKSMIVDESHFAKNYKADRTVACLELATGLRRERILQGNGKKKTVTTRIGPEVQYRYLLSGTPEPNRPVELESQLDILGVLDRFGGHWGFKRQFCDLSEEWIWVKEWINVNGRKVGRAVQRKIFHYDGATNTDQLQRMLREIVMVRRLKEDVLKDLPPKRHQCIELAANGLQHFIDEENELEDRYNELKDQLEDEMEKARDSGNKESFEQAAAKLAKAYNAHWSDMSRLAHLCALAKVPKVIEYCLEILEGEKKIAVFAHHHDVENELMIAFNQAGIEAVRLTGEENAKQKDAAIEAFQNGSARVFVGALKCGIGYTITAASRVILAELDWTPGVMDQAIDRLHRIGQKDSVLATYITLENSLDAKKVGMLISKRDISHKILDKELQDFTVPSGEPKPKVDRPDLPPTHVFAILDRLMVSLEDAPF